MPSYSNENSTKNSQPSICHQPIDTIQDKIDLIASQYDLIDIQEQMIFEHKRTNAWQANRIDELSNERKRFKTYWIIALVFLFVASAIATFEFNTIRYMASDLRDQRNINADLEQLLGGCMQSQFTLTGDSQ